MEFSLVLPLLLVLALGLIQVGLLARDRLLVEAAVRAAAPALDGASTFVTITREGARGQPVTVRVDYDDEVRVPLVGWLIGSAVHLDATAVMRQEFG